MKNDKADSREELALDALLAAALRQPEEAPLTDEEIKVFLKAEAPLSQDAKIALERLGPDAIKRYILGPSENETVSADELTSAQLYAAMNRNNPSAEHDPKTEEKLEQKRREILERLKKRHDRGNK